MPEPRALIAERPFQSVPILLLLAAAACAFAYGITTPTLTLEKFVVVEKTYSILNGVRGFWQNQQYFLFVVVGGFSLCLPVLKMILLSAILILPRRPGVFAPLVDFVDRIGRWSMLDVFVVATLVTTVQLGTLAKVTIHSGIYAFGACVIATLVGSTWTSALLRDANRRALAAAA